MATQIRRATKRRARLRMNIEGQPGGGKTYTAILLAKLLIGEPMKLPEGVDSKVVVIDTERGSAELYADDFDFMAYPLGDHSSRAYIAAIREAERFGAEVIVADSITHEWKWCLAEVDRIKPKFGGNKWSAWSDVRPPHDDFIEAMMGTTAHLIATTRAKPATSQEKDDGGKTVIRQLGLEGIQDDMMAFAFGIVMRMDYEHNGIITKTRCRALDNKLFPLPGEALVNVIRAWLESGDPSLDVAHTLDAAIDIGVNIAAKSGGLSEEQKKRAWGEAKGSVIAWCKGHGRSSEETKAAVGLLAERIKARLGGDAHPAGETPTTTAVATNGGMMSDAERLAAIDEGRA